MPIVYATTAPTIADLYAELVALEQAQDALRRRIRRLRADVDALIAAGG